MYSNTAYPSKHIGIVIETEYEDDPGLSFAPYKVRWTNHAGSERDWYREDELIKL